MLGIRFPEDLFNRRATRAHLRKELRSAVRGAERWFGANGDVSDARSKISSTLS
jgi:hypothetical protein